MDSVEQIRPLLLSGYKHLHSRFLAYLAALGREARGAGGSEPQSEPISCNPKIVSIYYDETRLVHGYQQLTKYQN